MAITISTVAGNAEISVDGGNPALILSPTGEVRVGVPTSVTTADPSQIVSAQNVIDYVQQNSLTSTAVTTATGNQYIVVPIPSGAKRITAVLNGVYFSNTTANSKAISLSLATSDNYATSGAGSVSRLTASAVATSRWVSLTTVMSGCFITNNSTTAVTTLLYGVVEFVYLGVDSQGDHEWSFSSSISDISGAILFNSAGKTQQDPNEASPILLLRAQYGGADMAFYGSISAVTES